METSNRLLAIHIMEILNEHSDAKHTMSQAELMERLKDKYGDDISRHTCSDYLKELRLEGYIAGARGVYRKDLFTERELRTLIDGVMYGKHIPEKDAKILIKKLKSLSENTMRSKAKNVSYFTGINRTDNANLYEILDTIDEAIDKRFKLKIYQYSPLPDGTKSEWTPKVVDPYYVVSDQSRYYLLCNNTRDDKPSFEPRRIDRFLKVEIVPEARTPLVDVVGYDFDLGRYMREHIYMFGGEAERIELKIESRYIGYLIDWYGPDFTVLNQDEKYTTVSLRTNADATYYWVLQYGGTAEVLYPESLRNRVKKGLEEILKKYEED